MKTGRKVRAGWHSTGLDERSQSLGTPAHYRNFAGSGKRGLWQAADETVNQLQALYLDIEGELEESQDDT